MDQDAPSAVAFPFVEPLCGEVYLPRLSSFILSSCERFLCLPCVNLFPGRMGLTEILREVCDQGGGHLD